MDKRCQKLLAQANARLKGNKVAIEYREEASCLYLRGTFPPKPGSGKTEPYRQRLALRNEYGLTIRATPAGIQFAEQRAKQLSAELNLNEFDWSHWLPGAVGGQKTCWLELWNHYAEHKRQEISATTVNHDFRRIRNHIQRCREQQLSDPFAIRDFLMSSTSPKTARRVLMQLSACCKWAMERSLLSSNPFAGMAKEIKVGKSQERIDPFSKEEVEIILKGFEGDRYYRHYLSFVKFLLMTGCRTSEAIALCWGHVAEDGSLVIFREAVVDGIRKGTKTNQYRRFPCPPKLKDLLLGIKPELPEQDEIVFPSPTGKLIDAHNFLNRAWKSVLDKQGVRYRCQYQTRHTFVTTCIEENIPVTQIAKWVGNSPEVILRHYAGFFNHHKVPEVF